MNKNAEGAARTLLKFFDGRTEWAKITGMHPTCEGQVYLEGDLGGHFSGYFDGGLAAALQYLPEICSELVKLIKHGEEASND